MPTKEQTIDFVKSLAVPVLIAAVGTTIVCITMSNTMLMRENIKLSTQIKRMNQDVNDLGLIDQLIEHAKTYK